MEHADKQVLVQRLEVEADELLSFVKHKKNKQWLWLAMDVKTKQVIAFSVGDRSKRSARKLWKAIPNVYKQNALFYTDQYEGSPGIIPAIQHRAIAKHFRSTNHIERLNCTFRQRLSRLVRATLSFSKKLSNHIGAIHYFICHYNLTLAVKFASQNAADGNIKILPPLLAYHYLTNCTANRFVFLPLKRRSLEVELSSDAITSDGG